MPPNLNNGIIESKKKKRKRKKNNKKKSDSSQDQSLAWRKTFENLTQWHSNHQVLYWKGVAERYQQQNQKLLQKLQSLEESNDDEESSDSEEDSDPTIIPLTKNDHESIDIDEEYLNFLEITRKHREEIQLQKLKDAASEPDTIV